jgi:hypothetical protein
MAHRNPNYYNLQSQRAYPLMDTATAVGDGGEQLPSDILVDCRLRWPSALGQYAFLGGITVTPHVVTALFIVTNSQTTTTFAPLAAVSIPQPVDEYRPYAITPFQPGTGGVVVFGNVRDTFNARFSTPLQSLLSPDCAQPYTELPIPSLRKQGARTGLVGDVLLRGGTDITATQELVALPKIGLRNAFVFRLTRLDAMQTYLGPCGGRPESGTCLKEGIESINDVVPDCNGNINIVIQGLQTAAFVNCGQWDTGMVLEDSIKLSEICLQQRVRNASGTDLCTAELTSEYLPCTLPFTETFGNGVPADFYVMEGIFDMQYAAYEAIGQFQPNTAIWTGNACTGVKTIGYYGILEFTLTNAYPENINGGLVFNFRHDVFSRTTGYYSNDFFYVHVNYNEQTVSLRHFTGISEDILASEAATVPLGACKVRIDVVAGETAGEVLFGVTAYGMGAGGANLTIGVSYTEEFIDSGQFGIRSFGATTEFTKFTVGESGVGTLVYSLPDFTEQEGTWVAAESSWDSTGTSSNVALWLGGQCIAATALGQYCLVGFTLDNANEAVNGGLVFNYRAMPDGETSANYFKLYADYLTQEIVLEHYKNGTAAELSRKAALIPLGPCMLRALILAQPMHCQVLGYGMDLDGTDLVYDVTLPDYSVDTGSFGVFSEGAETHFTYFQVGVADA